jgi:hypothetical protein
MAMTLINRGREFVTTNVGGAIGASMLALFVVMLFLYMVPIGT